MLAKIFLAILACFAAVLATTSPQQTSEGVPPLKLFSATILICCFVTICVLQIQGVIKEARANRIQEGRHESVAADVRETRDLAERIDKRAEEEGSSVERLRTELLTLLNVHEKKWSDRYDLGYGVAYSNGDRTTHENRFLTPVEFDWKAFDFTEGGGNMTVTLPAFRAKDVRMTFVGCTVTDSVVRIPKKKVMDANHYVMELDLEHSTRGGTAVVLGLRSR